MALKIRLRRQGRRNRPFYRFVVVGAERPRDGAYVEAVGTYNPFIEEGEQHVRVDAERIEYWIGKGAQMTEKAESLIARGAPELIKQHRSKLLEKRKIETAKRREVRKKKAAAK